MTLGKIDINTLKKKVTSTFKNSGDGGDGEGCFCVENPN